MPNIHKYFKRCLLCFYIFGQSASATKRFIHLLNIIGYTGLFTWINYVNYLPLDHILSKATIIMSFSEGVVQKQLNYSAAFVFGGLMVPAYFLYQYPSPYAKYLEFLNIEDEKVLYQKYMLNKSKVNTYNKIIKLLDYFHKSMHLIYFTSLILYLQSLYQIYNSLPLNVFLCTSLPIAIFMLTMHALACQFGICLFILYFQSISFEILCLAAYKENLFLWSNSSTKSIPYRCLSSCYSNIIQVIRLNDGLNRFFKLTFNSIQVSVFIGVSTYPYVLIFVKNSFLNKLIIIILCLSVTACCLYSPCFVGSLFQKQVKKSSPFSIYYNYF